MPVRENTPERAGLRSAHPVSKPPPCSERRETAGYFAGSLAVHWRDRLAAGEEWIRTLRSAILIMLRKTGLFETGQCTTEQGVAWGSGVARAFVKATGR